MHFIDFFNEQRLTKLITSSNMTHIRIGNHIFIPLEENEWAMLIEDGRVALLEKRRLAPVGRAGGYGMTILTGAAESHTNLENVMGSSEFLGFRTSSNAGLTHSIEDWIQIGVDADNPLVVRLPTEVDFRIETTYYVMKDYKTYFAATARNFLALDPQIKPQIQEYLRRRERFSFSDVRDLTGLVVHCNNLLAAAHGSSTPVSTEQVRYAHFSQTQTQARFTFGPRAGFNLTKFSEKSSRGPNPGNNVFKHGFQIGVVGEYTLDEIFSIQSGLLFSAQGDQYNLFYNAFGFELDHSCVTNLNYLQVPINMQAKVRVGNDFFVMVQTGPYFGYAISGKAKINGVDYDNWDWDPEGEGPTAYQVEQKIKFGKNASQMRALDFGLGFGAGLQFGSFQIGAGFNLGLANLSNLDSILDRETRKNRGFAFTAAYLFGK